MIAAGVKRAGRFKEMSLPVLWEVAEAKAKDKDAMHRRAGLHAQRAAFAIYRTVKDREELRAKLSELGEKALVAKLEEWGK